MTITNKHKEYEKVLTLVKANIPVMLIGEAGSGKTTLLEQVKTELGLDFYPMSMTRQTTLSSLVGFKNLNHEYQPTQLRKAVEFGGMLLLDEIDAADPNVLICLNTIENGFMAFPDGVVEVHKDFRLCATGNGDGKDYTARQRLDKSTVDRFDLIKLPHDTKLEKAIVGGEVSDIMNDIKVILANYSIEGSICLRPAIRLKKRLDLGMEEEFIKTLLQDDSKLYDSFTQLREEKKVILQEDIVEFDDLHKHILKKQEAEDEKTT